MASSSRRKKQQWRRAGAALESALVSLDRSRGPLFREIEGISREDRGPRSEDPHIHCTKKFNQMRITDLEAIDIARAFQEKPNLKGKLPEVYERIAKSLERLRDTEDAQPFDCPLLDGSRCMVHRVAKPIACLAWNPGREFSKDGWHSLERREKLNTALFGNEWQLKAIPLQLSRFLEEQDRRVAGQCGSTLRKKAMKSGELRANVARDEADAAKRLAERQRRRGRRGAARHAASPETKGSHSGARAVSRTGKPNEGSSGAGSRRPGSSRPGSSRQGPNRRGEGATAGDRPTGRTTGRLRRRAGPSAPGTKNRSGRKRP